MRVRGLHGLGLADDDAGGMSPRLTQNPDALAEFFGLLVECPLHGGNPRECLFCQVRALHLHDRYEWAKGLNADEAAVLRSRCAQCMAQGLAV